MGKTFYADAQVDVDISEFSTKEIIDGLADCAPLDKDERKRVFEILKEKDNDYPEFAETTDERWRYDLFEKHFNSITIEGLQLLLLLDSNQIESLTKQYK